MRKEPVFQTRREFLKRVVLGGAITSTIPGFLANTFSALHSAAAELPTQAVTGRDGTILVVLQMAGGNDGINTVVPYVNDYYRRARPRLALPESKVLKINSEVGFHPSLSPLKELYDAGQVAIVQGVGYPNPNRSHFRSTEIWQTASDSRRYESLGWLGRYFDNACAGADPTIGISVGRQMPQSFTSRSAKGISLENPQTFRFIAAKQEMPESPGGMEPSLRELNAPGAASSGGTIGSLDGSSSPEMSPLDFLERTALDAQASSDLIRSITAKAVSRATYPSSQLGNALKLVAMLIGGGMSTRVFYVSQGGYDTHTNQAANQERLLRDLGQSIQAFCSDIREQGNASRVLLMTFSEFGRRVAENANGGTDHGAAAPMFLMGEAVKPGLHGTYPSLAPRDLFQGDLKYGVDFRSVYSTILEQWLRTPADPVLGAAFKPIELLKS